MRPAAAGSPPAAVGTSGRAWSRARGRSRSRRWRATELPDEIPEDWIEQAEFELRGEVPTTFSEPALGPGDGDDGAREVAAAVRALVGLEGAA